MIKEMINEMNKAMQEGTISFDTVKNLCEQLSKLTGKKYGILNRRVTIEYGSHRQDAYINS